MTNYYHININKCATISIALKLPLYVFKILNDFVYRFQKDVRDTKEAGAAMAEADSCLKYALTMFPSALLPLLDKCGIEADAKAATRYIVFCALLYLGKHNI